MVSRFCLFEKVQEFAFNPKGKCDQHADNKGRSSKTTTKKTLTLKLEPETNPLD